MTNEPLDAPLSELTDAALARPLLPALVRARSDILAAARVLAAIPEAALERSWIWAPGGDAEVRYGGYRAAEILEQAEVDARTATEPAEASERQAPRLTSLATAARWDLHGLLLPLDDDLLDADPGGGEWTIRRTLGHTIGTQRSFGWSTAWWQSQAMDASDPDLPERPPASVRDRLPDEATAEAAGSGEDLRWRLDEVLDRSTERLAGLPDDRLAFGARYSGIPVTVGFRILRWPSHLREHTIQVEKTLAMLDHVPNEPARVVRDMVSAYGRAESVVYGRTGVDAAAARVAQGAAAARNAVESASQAAAG